MRVSDALGGARSAAPLSLPITTKRSPDAGFDPGLDQGRKSCPDTRGMIFVNTVTGEMVPARCRRLACAVCSLLNARSRARAIAFSKPERAILLTQVGSEWQQIRPRMARLKYELQERTNCSFEWVYHVEPNPKGTGHHVHAWERGAYIPQKTLSAAADSVGMGAFARINKIRQVEKASSYGLKGLGYGLKEFEAAESRSAYMLANGRRLTHQSPGFFVDSEGNSVGVRVAEREAASSGREAVGTWVMMAGSL